ncbi:MAG: hypothetical protein V1846_05215 [Candidatus Komeilibacteria bacterium]
MFTTKRLQFRQGKPVRSSGRKQPVPPEYRVMRHKKHHPLRSWIIFLFLVFIVGIGGLYWWNNRLPSFQGRSATLEVTGPAEALSGDTLNYKVTYTNNDQVTLTKVELDVQWPEGFYFDSASQAATDSFATTWKLPDVPAGQSASVEIRGQLVGDKDSQNEAVFRLNYSPQNFNSDFTEKQSVTTHISDTKLKVELQSPDKALAGQELQLTAIVTNQTASTIANLQADFTLPPDLAVASSSPSLVNNSWTGPIDAGKSLTFIITGTLAADATRSQNWLVEFGDKQGDKLYRLQKTRKDIILINPQLQLQLAINGKNKDFTANWGDQLNYQLTVSNSSAVDVADANINVLMDSDILDWSTFSGDGSPDNNNLTWKQVTLAAGQTVTYQWHINIQAKSKAGRSTVDSVAKLTINGLTGWQIISPLIVASVGEGLSFSQGVYWHLAGKQIGSGSLPPRVGKVTTYVVIWSIDNGAAKYSSVTISAIVPPDVEYVKSDSIDEGTLKYDTATGRLTWQIDNFGDALPPLQASFEISVTPTKDQAGQVLTLMNPASINAQGTASLQTKSSALRSSQVSSTISGDVGTVVN